MCRTNKIDQYIHNIEFLLFFQTTNQSIMGSQPSSEQSSSAVSTSRPPFMFRIETPIDHPTYQLFKVYKETKDGEVKQCTFNDIISEVIHSTTDTLSSQPQSFIYQFVNSIKNFPHSNAVFFETPSISHDSYINTPFEYVLIPSPALEQVQMDASSFQDKFDVVCSNPAASSSSRQYSASVVSFTNLSG